MNTQTDRYVGNLALSTERPINMEREVRRLLEPRILIIDSDAEHVRRIKTVLSSNGYTDVQVVTEPLFGLVQCCEMEPDVVILDPLHSLQHGHDILRDLIDLTSDGYFQPILVVSHDHTYQSRHNALLRGACDYYPKPFETCRLLRRVRQLATMTTINRVSRRAAQRQDQFTSPQHNEIFTAAMGQAIATMREVCVTRELQEQPPRNSEGDVHPDDIMSHACRVSAICQQLALAMGLGSDFIAHLELGALLHDIGKVAVPDEILFKPRHLSAAEYDLIKRHTTIGARALAPATTLQMQVAHSMAKWHHERWDGNGYPNQLIAEEIPLQARIVAVADAYDAMTSDRVYRRAMPTSVALDKIREQSGRQFDPIIAEAMLDLFATGSD